MNSTEQAADEAAIKPAAWALSKEGQPYKLMHERDERGALYQWTPLYDSAALDAAVAAERERWIAACDAERTEFAERAANNDGSRQSDFAFGSVNSAERIKAAGLEA